MCTIQYICAYVWIQYIWTFLKKESRDLSISVVIIKQGDSCFIWTSPVSNPTLSLPNLFLNSLNFWFERAFIGEVYTVLLKKGRQESIFYTSLLRTICQEHLHVHACGVHTTICMHKHMKLSSPIGTTVPFRADSEGRKSAMTVTHRLCLRHIWMQMNNIVTISLCALALHSVRWLWNARLTRCQFPPTHWPAALQT